ncbi:hypothetical protein PPERSA_08940 [Pseudocohnilembus persalinus]|uniref:Uncharacterized protein n=1 Tax=Pseudocohnilembus persalinus TaxID=266149 RepID=A0A0V0R2U9_PSEPJ|nr:hypothetical protein PPERSA_08940 [Pseudocohnilembus persalinus]|eukprot:KRX08836.1 hypothetical protein PPERSA_08940 [Pseudocohnilembus persalinus]
MFKQFILVLVLIVIAQSCSMSDMVSCTKKFNQQLENCGTEQGILSCIANVEECQSCAQRFIKNIESKIKKTREIQDNPTKLTSFACDVKKGMCQAHCDSFTNSCYKTCLKQAGC